MAANVQQTVSPRSSPAAGLTAHLRLAVAALLAAAAVILALRRLSGALQTPLTPVSLLVAGGVLAALACIAHAPARRGRPGTMSGTMYSWSWWVGNLLVSLSVLVTAASLSLPGSHWFALFGLWTTFIGQEIWAWRGLLPGGRLPSRPCKHGARGNGRLAICPTADGESADDMEPAEPPADVLQQLTLRTTAEGGQELSGWLRMPLAAGQRTGSLHVAFCPSFARTPKVEVEAVCGPDCRIKAGQVLPYGVRLDIKLNEPARVEESVLAWLHAGEHRETADAVDV